MKKILKIVCLTALIALVSAMFFGCVPQEEAKTDVPEKYINEFDADKPFDYSQCVEIEKGEGPLNVLQLTDIHFDDANGRKEETLELLAEQIESNRPDVIAVTGDWVSEESDRHSAAKKVFDVIDSYGIPWAPVFGNHDAEGEMSKYDYADFFAGYENSVFRAGYSNIKGVGNYIIAIKENGKLVQALFMIDSHSAVKRYSAKYDYIGASQIEWYGHSVDGLNALYKQQGGTQEVIPSLAFFHIPLNEYQTAYDKAVGTQNLIVGGNREKSFPPYKNTGLFRAFTDKKSTKGAFCGHDHDNNSASLYKDIVLAYGVQSGWCDEYATGSKKGSLTALFKNDGTLGVYHNYSRIF